MKAVRIHEYGNASKLELEEAPNPPIAPGQMRVKVQDAGVNPIDWKIRAGYMKERMPAMFPLTMGQDFSGKVAELGKNVAGFKVGDRAFGFAKGSYAEYAVADASEVAKLPDSIDFPLAATLPTAGLTALQLVRDVIKANRDMVVLIHGAGGGVGSFAAQLARNFGARVIATASLEDTTYLRSIGVEHVIDYKRERFEQKLTPVDAVIDLVGGETLARSYLMVRKGGIIATTVQPVDQPLAKQAGIRAVQFLMKRRASDLADLAKFVDQGTVKPRLSRVLDLAHAKDAQLLNETGHSHGKFVLEIAKEPTQNR
jgi:NADPH:quinone reductase-like Zn-dependent oxidoreductase